MSKLNCNVVRDILPLYADEVVCDDTRELVEEHLNKCEACRQELFAMKVQVAMPVQTDAVENLKKVKNEWGKRQLWKGVLLTLLAVGILFGAFGMVCRKGIPANSGDIVLVAGLECFGAGITEEIYENLGWDQLFPFGERQQQWIIHMETTNGSHLIVDSETKCEENSAGKKISSHIIYRVKTLPAVLADQFEHKFNTAAYHSFDEIPASGDCKVTIVFADKEITYSMKEEGLWDATSVHEPEVCGDCWGQRPW